MLRYNRSGRSAVIPILIVLSVLGIFAWQTGLLNQYFNPTPPGPGGQTFTATVSSFADPVASNPQYSADSRTVTVEASNVVLSNAGVDYSASFVINVRDTKSGDGGESFNMTVTVGSYVSPGGTLWPVLVKDATGQCPDISYSAVTGGTGVEVGCSMFYGTITVDGSSVSITVTIQVNGDLFGTGLPPTGFGIPLTFSIAGAQSVSVVWKASS